MAPPPRSISDIDQDLSAAETSITTIKGKIGLPPSQFKGSILDRLDTLETFRTTQEGINSTLQTDIVGIKTKIDSLQSHFKEFRWLLVFAVAAAQLVKFDIQLIKIDITLLKEMKRKDFGDFARKWKEIGTVQIAKELKKNFTELIKEKYETLGKMLTKQGRQTLRDDRKQAETEEKDLQAKIRKLPADVEALKAAAATKQELSNALAVKSLQAKLDSIFYLKTDAIGLKREVEDSAKLAKAANTAVEKLRKDLQDIGKANTPGTPKPGSKAKKDVNELRAAVTSLTTALGNV